MVCPAYAKIPSGEAISLEWLNTILHQQSGGSTITSFRVDESSTIEGRHSTTFRVLLDWSLSSQEDGVAADDGNGTGRTCGPDASVFVKRMTCSELPPRSLTKWRTSIASYRAEATFFKSLAGSPAVGAIVPKVLWAHVDDRLGDTETDISTGNGGEGSVWEKNGDEEEAVLVEALRESCFMMITEDLGGSGVARSAQACLGEHGVDTGADRHEAKNEGWEQVGALDLGRAKALLSAAARLHASFWPNLSPIPAVTVRKDHHDQQQQQERPNGDPKPASFHHSNSGGGGRYPRGLHEQGTFWSLEKRDPGDLAGLEQEYQKLLGNFSPLLPAAWFERLPAEGQQGEDEIGRGGAARCSKRRALGDERRLGHRLAARAVDLDAAVHAHGGGASSSSGSGWLGSASSGDVGRKRGRSLVHGDLKAWNVFFSIGGWAEAEEEGSCESGGSEGCQGCPGGTDAPGDRVKIIDWQWCGEGLAAADVAYVVCTSLEPCLLSKERGLLGHYHAELSRGLDARFGKPPPGDVVAGGEPDGNDGAWYPFDQFVDDYRVAFLDYMRCVVGTLWKGLTPSKMERNRSSGPGMSLINRSTKHMQWMIEKATRLLDELDSLEEEK